MQKYKLISLIFSEQVGDTDYDMSYSAMTDRAASHMFFSEIAKGQYSASLIASFKR